IVALNCPAASLACDSSYTRIPNPAAARVIQPHGSDPAFSAEAAKLPSALPAACPADPNLVRNVPAFSAPAATSGSPRVIRNVAAVLSSPMYSAALWAARPNPITGDATRV